MCKVRAKYINRSYEKEIKEFVFIFFFYHLLSSVCSVYLIFGSDTVHYAKEVRQKNILNICSSSSEAEKKQTSKSEKLNDRRQHCIIK